MTRQFEEFQLDHFTPTDIIGVDSRGRTKTRHIMLPDAEATQAHNIALKRMYADGLVDDPWAIGGMPGESLINNILPHKDNSEFYLLDIEDAFSQVSIVKLKEMFAEMFDMDLFDHETLDYYTEFLDTYASSYRARGLPQGAPCSPYLFNLYCQPMDYELGKFCDQNQLTYTRWLDDITVSSPAGDNLLGPAARKGAGA